MDQSPWLRSMASPPSLLTCSGGKSWRIHLDNWSHTASPVWMYRGSRRTKISIDKVKLRKSNYMDFFFFFYKMIFFAWKCVVNPCFSPSIELWKREKVSTKYPNFHSPRLNHTSPNSWPWQARNSESGQPLPGSQPDSQPERKETEWGAKDRAGSF